MKGITIELFRVSKDSKYLDLKFSCPRYYYFTSLEITAKLLTEGKFKKTKWELGEYLFTEPVLDENNNPVGDETQFITDKTDWVVRIPLKEALDVDKPGIYDATFTATFNRELWEDEHPDWQEWCESDLPDGENLIETATTSDVNFAYRCMLDDLLQESCGCSCPQVSDEAVRKYLILYGHQAALTTGDDEVAEVYFKLLSNCFNRCGNNERSGAPHKGCGCKR